MAARIADEISRNQPQSEFCGDGYCMLEAERISQASLWKFLRRTCAADASAADGRAWHIGKVLFEKWWLAPPGWKREFYATLMRAGGKAYGIPVAI